MTKQNLKPSQTSLKAVALPRGHLSLKLRPRTGLCDRWVMVGWQQQICLRVRREPGKEHLALSIGIPSTPLCFSYHHSDIYLQYIIILWLSLMDFFCMTSSGKHVTLVSMLVTSRELCYLRCLVGIVALVQHSGCFHKAFVIVNILTGPKKGAETGRLEKWGQRERKNQLINNWKERLEELKK